MLAQVDRAVEREGPAAEVQVTAILNGGVVIESVTVGEVQVGPRPDIKEAAIGSAAAAQFGRADMDLEPTADVDGQFEDGGPGTRGFAEFAADIQKGGSAAVIVNFQVPGQSHQTFNINPPTVPRVDRAVAPLERGAILDHNFGAVQIGAQFIEHARSVGQDMEETVVGEVSAGNVPSAAKGQVTVEGAAGLLEAGGNRDVSAQSAGGEFEGPATGNGRAASDRGVAVDLNGGPAAKGDGGIGIKRTGAG